MDPRINLYQDLNGADLRGADLSGADLSGRELAGANLSGANLQGVNLVRANLQGAQMFCASLITADLSNANLQGANLEGTDCRIVVFPQPNGQISTMNVSMCGANLVEAILVVPSLTMLTSPGRRWTRPTSAVHPLKMPCA